MKCQQFLCEHQATSQVKLELRVDPYQPPATSTQIIKLCDSHATCVTWCDVMPDEEFEKICQQFESMGRMRPVKKYCNIVIEPITDE